MDSKVTLIIPYYNTPQSLAQLLMHIDSDFPTIVVNNSVRQPTVPKVVQLLDNAFNMGFSHAANQGALAATTPWLLFLNSDISLTSEDIHDLVEMAEMHTADAASPVLIDSQGNIQWNYHQPLPTFFSLLLEYSPLRVLKPKSHTSQKTVLPGACLLIRRDVFEKLGGWSEQFWLWWEDVDLSQRLYNQNYSVLLAANLKVQHEGGESFAPLAAKWKKDIFFHSMRAYLNQYFPRWQAAALEMISTRFSLAKLYQPDEVIRVSIIIPNVRPELIEKFLANNLKFLNTQQDEVIFVTSAGTERVLKWRQQHPEMIFINLTENRGFSHTVNTGFRRARGQFLITVNDDTILEKGWVDSLIKHVKKSTGSVSPRIVGLHGDVESLGIQVVPKGKAIPILNESSQKPDAFNAAAVLLTRQAVEKVGLFDENFGSYLEDIDLGLRMQRAGFTHEVAPNVTITHLKHQTSQGNPSKKAWQDFKNWWFVVLKNWSFTTWLQYSPAIFTERARNLSGWLKAKR